jgi:hypothetical protein
MRLQKPTIVLTGDGLSETINPRRGGKAVFHDEVNRDEENLQLLRMQIEEHWSWKLVIVLRSGGNSTCRANVSCEFRMMIYLRRFFDRLVAHVCVQRPL